MNTTTSAPTGLLGRAVTVVDIEGNGQQPPDIVEIALLSLAAGGRPKVADLRSWLVRPPRPITAVVTGKVHGITNRDVAAQPTWSQIAGEVAALLSGRVVVAHHATVEHRVLSAHLSQWRPGLILDTLRLAKAIWPGRASYALDRLVAEVPLPSPPPELDTVTGCGQGHRAGYDTWMTAQLLVRLAAESGMSWDALAAAGRISLPPMSSEAEPPQPKILRHPLRRRGQTNDQTELW